MRHFSTLLFLLISSILLPAQNCFPDGIIFNKQSQIDSFALAFPECINILGSVRIDEFQGDPITSLEGLAQIRNIGGNLEITNNTVLQTLAGLNDLNNLNGNLLIRGNDALQSIEALVSLEKIEGHVNIANNNSLQNLNGLKKIKTIDKFVFISTNNALNSLNGLDSLHTVKSVFRVHQNPGLTNFSGLQSLSKVGALAIDSNVNLVNINALAGLTQIEDTLRIRFCNALVQASFPALTDIGGDVIIRSNAQLTALNLGNVSNMPGSLNIISNENLNNLSGLQNITGIGGDLTINNIAVQHLSGFNNCTSVGGDVKIINNPLLTTLNGIQQINAIGGLLGIGGNTVLGSLDGLNNDILLTDTLALYNNPVLETLDGLANMNLSGLAFLVLQSNDQLTVCGVPSICQFLQNNAALASISNNDSQCNSIEQVIFKCTSGVDDMVSDPVVLYPNPCSDQLWISGARELFDVRVYNQLGQLVRRIDHINSGEYIDTQLLERGYYYVHTAEGWFTSFIKI